MADVPELAELDAFYEAELRPWLMGFEKKRRLFLAIAVGGILLAAFPVAGLIWLGWPEYVLFISFVTFVAAIAPLIFLGKKIEKQLLARICEKLDFALDPKAGTMSIQPFSSLSLVPSYDTCSLDNAIQGKIDEVPFELCESHLQEQRRNSKGRTHYVTVFQGLVGSAQFPKRFHGTTIVRRDGGFLASLFSSGKGDRVKLEDPDFEKRFDVFSDDQVEARYLLTPGFMERVKRLDDLSDGAARLAFQGGRLLFAIGGGDRFTVSLFKNMGEIAHFRRMMADFALIFGIVRELNLAAKTRL